MPLQPRYAEVHDLQHAVGVEQQVLRLDVAMDHALFVRGGERLRQLARDGERRRHAQPAARVEQRSHGDPLDVLHREVIHPAVLPYVVRAHHVLVGDVPRQPNLRLEALEHAGIEQGLRPQRLDGHLFVELPVERTVHHAHAAAADLGANFVAVCQQRARRQRRRRARGVGRRRARGIGNLLPQRLHLVLQPPLARAHLVGHGVEDAGQPPQFIAAVGHLGEVASRIGSRLHRGGRLDHAPHFAQVLELDVAQPFLLEAGANARPQQHGIERLGQVILRAALDAPHHARHVVERRDHDDRNVTRGGIGLQAFEHRQSIEVGHEHVEQHEVEARRPHLSQRGVAAAHALHGVSLPLQAPLEHRAVVLLIVHHEDARRPHRRHALSGVVRRVFHRDRDVAHPVRLREAHDHQAFGRAAHAPHIALEFGVRRLALAREQLRRGREDPLLRLPQRHAQHLEVRRGNLAARRRHRRIDAIQQIAPRRQRALQRRATFRRLRVLEQHLAIADDQVERRAQFVAKFGHGLRCRQSVHSPGPSRAWIFPRRRSSSTGLVS